MLKTVLAYSPLQACEWRANTRSGDRARCEGWYGISLHWWGYVYGQCPACGLLLCFNTRLVFMAVWKGLCSALGKWSGHIMWSFFFSRVCCSNPVPQSLQVWVTLLRSFPFLATEYTKKRKEKKWKSPTSYISDDNLNKNICFRLQYVKESLL